MNKIRFTLPVLLLVAVLSLSTLPAFAEEETKGNELKIPTPSSAMMFSIYKDYSYEPGTGLSFWYMRWSAGKLGWRAGMNIDGDLSSTDTKSDYYDSTSHSYEDGERSDLSYDFDIVLQLLYRFDVHDKISAFGGIGPVLGWGHDKEEFVEKHSDDPRYDNDWTRTRKGLSGGVFTSFGAEWHFVERMSIVSEYSLSMIYSWRKEEYDRELHDETIIDNMDSHYFTINTGAIRLGLVYYF